MALDPSIIMQLQPYRAPDPMEGMSKAMTLGNLMQQRQLGGIQMQQAQQALADDQAVRQAYQQSGGDPTKTGQALQAGGLYKQYEAFQKAQMDRQKAQAEMLQQRAKTAEINDKLMKSSMPMLGSNPSDEAIMQVAQRLKNLGAFDEAGAKTFAQQFTSIPMDQRGRAVMQYAASPSDFIKMMTPDIQMTDAGGSVVPVDKNAFTNPNQQAISKTATPGDLLSDARGKASNAIAAGQLGVAKGNLAVNQGRLELDRTSPKLIPIDTAMGPAFANPRTQEVIPATMNGKPIPPKEGEGAKKERLANENSLAQLDESLKLLEKYPKAFGMAQGIATAQGGALGSGFVAWKAGEEGAQARSFVFSKAAALGHELLGAAQTPSEQGRIKSFLPQETDSADVIANKLKGLMKEAKIKQRIYGGAAAPAPATDDPLGLRK